MNALQTLAKERTDWRPPTTVTFVDGYETAGQEPGPVRLDHLWLLVPGRSHHSFTQRNLLQKAWLDVLTCRVTTVPVVCFLTHPIDDAPETAAQQMAAELRRLSGLTNEEIAPLLGVSRRSLQAWVAGESISARKETRLRAVLDAIRNLAADNAPATRARLLDRQPHSVSAYDLLVEERYDAAVAVVTGTRRSRNAPEPAGAESLVAQLDRIEDSITVAPRLNRRLSGPLRR